MLQYKKYYMPQSLEELFRFLDNFQGTFDIIAGGTDRFAGEKDPSKRAEVGVDISNIAFFSRTDVEEDRLLMGANTRIQDFLTNRTLVDCVPILRHSAIYFADQQIREMATLGGNLANASPTGDMIPPLLALDGTVHTVMWDGNGVQGREIPMGQFIKGVGKTILQRGELISFVSCPILKGYGCAFKKVGQRRSLCISTVNSAFLVKTDPAGKRFEDVRIAFGGVAPVPVRVTEVEDALHGAPITRQAIFDALERIPQEIVQSRSRREYRKRVIRNFILAGLYESLAELGVQPQ